MNRKKVRKPTRQDDPADAGRHRRVKQPVGLLRWQVWRKAEEEGAGRRPGCLDQGADLLSPPVPEPGPALYGKEGGKSGQFADQTDAFGPCFGRRGVGTVRQPNSNRHRRRAVAPEPLFQGGGAIINRQIRVPERIRRTPHGGGGRHRLQRHWPNLDEANSEAAKRLRRKGVRVEPCVDADGADQRDAAELALDGRRRAHMTHQLDQAGAKRQRGKPAHDTEGQVTGHVGRQPEQEWTEDRLIGPVGHAHPPGLGVMAAI